ncbi:BURP domain protein RD22 [Vitis vinifera]|uniref:BURP domain protein RD22 n=1 Tax=Vitis vinifera TaxID=29760 RepID=A0A438G318_VITVI|nr:BURP domain protein RD22 [Vitis vinifera]
MATAKESWPPYIEALPSVVSIQLSHICLHSFLLVTELWPLVVVESHASLRSELYWPLVLPNIPNQLTLTAGDSDLPSEIYWNSVLPNTPMPQAVKNSLRPEESTGVEIGKGTDIGVSKGGVSVSTGHEEKPAYVGVTKGHTFFYSFHTGREQVQTLNRIAAGVEKMGGDVSVVCHKMVYAYAVFYCHKIAATRAYMVPLVGRDGTKAKAVDLCHTNTKEWNPKHLAFQLLKVKPGVPICHFLTQDQIIWVVSK